MALSVIGTGRGDGGGYRRYYALSNLYQLSNPHLFIRCSTAIPLLSLTRKAPSYWTVDKISITRFLVVRQLAFVILVILLSANIPT